MTDPKMYSEALAGLRQDLAEADGEVGELEQRLTVAQERRAKIAGAVASLADLLGLPATNGSAPRAVAETVPPVAAPVVPSVPSAIQGLDATEYPTTMEAAHRVLRREGRHLRAEPIARRIVDWGMADPNADFRRLRATVGAVLGRKATERKVFTRPGVGLFGLIEWNGRGPNESQEQLMSAFAEMDGGTEEQEEQSADHDES